MALQENLQVTSSAGRLRDFCSSAFACDRDEARKSFKATWIHFMALSFSEENSIALIIWIMINAYVSNGWFSIFWFVNISRKQFCEQNTFNKIKYFLCRMMKQVHLQLQIHQICTYMNVVQVFVLIPGKILMPKLCFQINIRHFLRAFTVILYVIVWSFTMDKNEWNFTGGP